MDSAITRAEHEEFRRRIDEEHKRQDTRLRLLEESVKDFSTLGASIEKLAVNMENMLKEQVKQGERLEALESRDGEKWRSIVTYAITAVVGIMVGYVCNKLGFGG